MLKRVSVTILSIVAGTFLVALVTFLFSAGHGLAAFSSILIWCSIGVAVMGGCMISGATGPRRSHDADLQSAAYQSNPDLAKLDRKEKERGASLGSAIFISGVISAAIGYALYSVA